MSQKTEKPVLSGQRIKARKRDEREKYDPFSFRDAILQGIADSENLDEVKNFLEKATLDYRRYAETLFDILFAGGILEPGGSIRESENDIPASTRMCVFGAEDSMDVLYDHYDVFYKLIRRHKYLEKSLDEHLKKLIMFLKGFSEEERRKLAKVIGILLANNLVSPNCLVTLFEDHLVKEGLSIQFAADLFRAWLSEKDKQNEKEKQNLGGFLKKAGLEARLLELLPIHRRTQENFENYFRAANLDPLVEYQRAKAIALVRKNLQVKLTEMIKDEEPVKEMIELAKQHITKSNINEADIIGLVWSTIMGAVEWTKKEEMVAEQSIRHLKIYASLLASLTTSGQSQLSLIKKMQEYCYDNMAFMKVFQKIVLLLYNTDVLGEDAILKWYKDSHLPKGKSFFLEQMTKMVEWLQNAEEESDEDD